MSGENPLKLEIEAVINDNQVDNSIRKIQSKLKDIEGLAGKSSDTTLSPQSQQLKGQQDKILQDAQKRYLNELNGQYDKIKKTMADIDKLYQNDLMRQDSKNKMQEKFLELKKQEKMIEDQLGIKKSQPDGDVPEPSDRGKKPPPKDSPSSLSGALKQMMTIGAVTAIVGTTIKAIDLQNRSAMVTEQARGAATQGAARPLGEFFEGKGAFGAIFKEERAKALDIASEKAQTTRIMDNVKMALPLVLGAVGGLLGVSGGPGGIVMGTVAGAAAGAAIGGTFSDKGLAKIKSAAGDSSTYNAMLASETMADWNSVEASIIAQDPLKYEAQKTQQKYGKSLLNYRRGSGFGTSEEATSNILDNSQFGGGRYNPEDIINNMNQLAQGGASSESLRGDSAGQIESLKRYGMKSAGGVVARLKSLGQEANNSDENLKKIFAEAVKVGVDLSKMPQELDRFSQKATELATATGGFSSAAIELLSKSIGDVTSKPQVEAGASFIEQMMQQSRSFEGLAGQVGYGFMQSDKAKDLLGEQAFGNLQKNSNLQNYIQANSAGILGDKELQTGVMRDLGMDKGSSQEIEQNQKALQNFLKEIMSVKTFLGDPRLEKLKEESRQSRESYEKEKNPLSSPYKDTEQAKKIQFEVDKILPTTIAGLGKDPQILKAMRYTLLGTESTEVEGKDINEMITGKKVFGQSQEKLEQMSNKGSIEALRNFSKNEKSFGDKVADSDGYKIFLDTVMSNFKTVLESGSKEAMTAFKEAIMKNADSTYKTTADKNDDLRSALDLIFNTTPNLTPGSQKKN